MTVEIQSIIDEPIKDSRAKIDTNFSNLKEAVDAAQTDIASKAKASDLTAHESDTSTHGVTEIVGRTETQTLTNKTLTSPTVQYFKNSANVTAFEIGGNAAASTHRIKISNGDLATGETAAKIEAISVDSNADIVIAPKGTGILIVDGDISADNLSGTNTGNETTATIKTKLGITTLSGSNTGDQVISDATLSTSDITTNNVSTTKHGFVPKAPNDTSKFLRGDGTWAVGSAVAALNDLTDVTITTPASGEVLSYNGSAWVNDAISGASIVQNEVPTGSVNGSNTVFTTAYDFVNTKITVILNRTELKLNEDYTVTDSNEVTLTTAPATNDDIWVHYVRSDTVLIGDTSYEAPLETPTGSVNGSNTVFTTSEPYIAGTLKVYLQGQRQIPPINYSETTSTTFTMAAGSIPVTDDSIRCEYQTALTPAGNADTLDGKHATYFVQGPRGYLINGKITVTDSGSGLVVAVKTLAGSNPSTLDPVYVRIGDTVRTITASLSRTLADGTNWFNAGSTELATKEIDYFAYLIWNTNSSAVGLGFARIPYANLISDFSVVSTNEKYLAGYSAFNSTDEVEVIGRFAATLSAGAGYTWSVPTFTAANLVQRPIHETRWLIYEPTVGFVGTSAPTTPNSAYTLSKYQITGDTLFIRFYRVYGVAGTGITSVTISKPMAHSVEGLTDSVGTNISRTVPLALQDCITSATGLIVSLPSIALSQIGIQAVYKI